MIRTQNALFEVGLLRSLQLGDCWFYRVSGHSTRPGGASPLALRGTIAVTIAVDTLIEHPNSFMLTFAQTLEIEADDGAYEPFPAPDLKFSFVQDPETSDAAILADNMGRNGACRRAEPPQIFYPGRWLLGTRYDNRLEFGGGDFVRNTLRVTGRVSIKTPLGSFDAWVAEISSQSPSMGETTGIDWWTPDLGAPACFETTTTSPDGRTIRIHAMLVGTSVLPEPVLSGEREHV